MLKQILIKLLHLPTTLHIKLYPRINRMILKAYAPAWLLKCVNKKLLKYSTVYQW